MDKYAVLVFHGQAHDERAAARLHPRRSAARAGDRDRACSAPTSTSVCPRRSPTYPTSTRTTSPSPSTTVAGCSPSATACGTPTARSRSYRPSTRCCMHTQCRPRAATPSSPTCARPTMRSTQETKDWRGPRVRAFADLLARACSASPSSRRGARALQRRCASASCESTPRRDASRSTSPPTPARSSAGRCRRRAFLRDLTEIATQREFVYSHKW